MADVASTDFKNISQLQKREKNWLGRIYAARSCIRRRIGIQLGEEVEDSYRYERTVLYNWRTSGTRRKETPEKEIPKSKRNREWEELLKRIKKGKKTNIEQNFKNRQNKIKIIYPEGRMSHS